MNKNKEPVFSQASIDFIVEASRQKKPEWLDKHRDEYDKVLVQPMKHLMEQAALALKHEAPGYRFPTRGHARLKRSKDNENRPFRDWIGISVSRAKESRYESFPNLYFELSEEDMLSAGGLYMPGADQTRHIRKWIDQDPQALIDLLDDPDFKKCFQELGTERMLKTKPRDYPVDHPHFDWLKLSAWYVWRPFTKKQVFSKNLTGLLIEDWRQVLRLNRILDRYTASFPKTGVIETIHKISPRKMDF